MERFYCVVRRGEGAETRALDSDEDDVETSEGYADPVALMNDPSFESALLLEGAGAYEVLALEGHRVGPGALAGSDQVIVKRVAKRTGAGAWLAAMAVGADASARLKAHDVLEGVSSADAFRAHDH